MLQGDRRLPAEDDELRERTLLHRHAEHPLLREQRLLLELAWHALEDAACDSAADGPVGVFAGVGFNAYFVDNLRGRVGLAGEPDRDQLLAEGRDAFGSQAAQWVQLVLPGRVDVQAPVGDVEPEMPFWMTALHRLALWYGNPDSAWVVRRLPPGAMPAALLDGILERGSVLKEAATRPSPASDN